MRKVIIKILTLILLSVSGLVLAQTGTFQLGYTGAYPNYYGASSYAINWNYYKEMNLNLWQGWWVGDTAVSVINALNTNNINGYFQPDTLRWIGYGRMQVNYAWHGRDERFKYNGVSQCGVQYQDNTWNNGKTVLYFDASDSSCNLPGLVLYNVKQNAFQSLTGLVGDPMFTVEFPNGGGQQFNTYYIKPRIRISVEDAFSIPPKNVCKVMINAFDGSTVKEVTITTANFRDTYGSNYNGQYLEDYYQCPIFISADTLNWGRPLWSYGGDLLDQCQVDYQIYWFGTVSVYIDYVKVMDEPAQELFGTRPLDILIKNRLRDKIVRLKSNDIGHKVKGFYMEEIDYSNLSCLKFLNDTLLPAWSGNDANYKMIPLLNPNSFMAHLRDQEWSYFWNYFDSIKIPVFLTSNNLYTSLIDSTRQLLSELPQNLSTTLAFPPYYSQGIKNEIQYVYDAGTNFVSLDEYNSYLQTRLGIMEGYLKYLFSPSCNQHNVNLVAVPSVSFWHYHTSNFLNREPMTSEIEVQFGIEICNGAKGILPFAYESWHSDYFNNNSLKSGGFQRRSQISGQTDFHYDMSLGASDFDADSTWGWRKRSLDVYGENKWDSLKSLYAKMKVWGPILANSTSTAGYSITDDGANHQFISDIHSIDPSRSSWFDYDVNRYWEMGFFYPPASPKDRTKYVMFVNRRCIPAAGGYHGDNRVLMIKFNSQYLPGGDNLKIIDVFTGQQTTFSKSYNGYINLGNTDGSMGWFHPGEAKLFMIVSTTKRMIPRSFALNQNYPNPFNPVTTIMYDIPNDSKVKMTIYDILGREVVTLVNENQQAGRYYVEFNGNNYASGVYFYKIEAGDFVQTKKMVLVK